MQLGPPCLRLTEAGPSGTRLAEGSHFLDWRRQGGTEEKTFYPTILFSSSLPPFLSELRGWQDDKWQEAVAGVPLGHLGHCIRHHLGLALCEPSLLTNFFSSKIIKISNFSNERPKTNLEVGHSSIVCPVYIWNIPAFLAHWSWTYGSRLQLWSKEDSQECAMSPHSQLALSQGRLINCSVQADENVLIVEFLQKIKGELFWKAKCSGNFNSFSMNKTNCRLYVWMSAFIMVKGWINYQQQFGFSSEASFMLRRSMNTSLFLCHFHKQLSWTEGFPLSVVLLMEITTTLSARRCCCHTI